MKFLSKKIYIILYLLIALFNGSEAFARDGKNQYSSKDISNYFIGIISTSKDYNNNAFEHLKKIKSIKGTHSNFDVEFVRTLVSLEKFEQAFTFSKNTWNENELLFETDLLLGINLFLKKDYLKAEKYFERLNKISQYNLIFDNFVGNILMAWSKASQGKKEESFSYMEKIPKPYQHLTTTQNIFLKCFFDGTDTQEAFDKLISNEQYNFSRYNFFLINYLLDKNKNFEAKKIITNSRNEHSSNLLIRQTEYFFLKNNEEKIKNTFNCKNPNDALAEFFYVIANLYSSEGDYRISNFYLKISLFLNDKFITNRALLAENFYYQEKNEEAKKIYSDLKLSDPVYYWYASKNIASILLKEKGKEYSIRNLEKDFDLLIDPNFEHYYEMANYYKDNEFYEKSIEYYSLALEKIKKNNDLFPKILHRRGTSFERLGDWEKAEKDLEESLRILPDQAHVLNYLAYTWVDKGINLDRGLKMLERASELRKNDGYIIDSLGWAYYAKKNYDKAKYFLQQAVELLPADPIINDHYGDALWMINQNIQARYVWNYVLKLDGAEEDLKKNVKKKLIFGLIENYN